MSDTPVFEPGSAEALAQAASALAEEHRALGRLTEQILGAREIGALVAALEELNRTLVAHFGHEEAPEGLYDALGICVPANRERLAELVDEHYRMTASARSLAERARWILGRFEALQEEARGLVELLRRHEQHEHGLVREATGQATSP
jgi:hypothetical protein